MRKVFTQEEFSKLISEIVLTANYVDYDYYAVYIPKIEGPELYFQNPNDGNYYSVEDMYSILRKSIHPNHDIFIETVFKEFISLQSMYKNRRR